MYLRRKIFICQEFVLFTIYEQKCCLNHVLLILFLLLFKYKHVLSGVYIVPGLGGVKNFDDFEEMKK